MTTFLKPAFLSRSVIYEVNIRQYTPEGTFQAFCKHLPGLKEMGVDILWLMPIHPIGMINRKGLLGSYYSISDHFAINPEFGEKENFQHLIKLAHELEMKVIIDWVANHVSWDNIWTKTNPEFIKQENGKFVSPFDWTDVLQLDHTNLQQRSEMIKAMQYWVEQFDIDGFRADLPHLVPLDFWRAARTQIDPMKKDLIWLGETEAYDYSSVFDITFTWNWMHAVENKIKHSDSIQPLKVLLKEKQLPGFRLYFTSNHDENSWNGTEYEKYGIFAQALAVFSATFPASVPLVYSGQEIPNHTRLPFFEKSNLKWSPKPALADFYMQLFALRTHHPAFFGLDLNWQFIDVDELLVYEIYSNKTLRVILNLSNEAQHISLNGFDIVWMQYQTVEEDTELVIQPGGYRIDIK